MVCARRKGPEVSIRAEFGTLEFDAEYQAALPGTRHPQKAGESQAGTLAWLIERYRETSAWSNALSLATRRQRENIFKQVIGRRASSCAQITQAGIIAGARPPRKDTPAQARQISRRHARTVPMGGQGQDRQDRPNRWHRESQKKKGAGFPVWSEDDVAAYERRWPFGTKERVWLDVLLYTGLRRGDAVDIGRQHVRDGIATLRTEKSQGEMIVSHPDIASLATHTRCRSDRRTRLHLRRQGQAADQGVLRQSIQAGLQAAGLPNRSAHGLRKIAATRAAENGATVAQLEAIFGWNGGRMASL